MTRAIWEVSIDERISGKPRKVSPAGMEPCPLPWPVLRRLRATAERGSDCVHPPLETAFAAAIVLNERHAEPGANVPRGTRGACHVADERRLVRRRCARVLIEHHAHRAR